MDTRYITLATLAAIVQEKLHPAQYACTAREMILHSSFDWEHIHADLKQLDKEGMVLISPAENLQFFITQSGLDLVSSREPVLQAGTAFILHEVAVAE